MRKIGVKQLRAELARNLGQLPFEITLRGKVIAVVKHPKGYVEVRFPKGYDLDKMLREGTDI